jgi:uncharacterized membrane protein YtjA (UPF0391 family)
MHAPVAGPEHGRSTTTLSANAQRLYVRFTKEGKEFRMLHYAIVFLVIALIAALFGFGGIAAGAVEIAKILFFVFIVMAVVAFIISLGRRP